MKLSIKNKHLKKVIEFLENMDIKDNQKASRVRVKINNKLQEKLSDFSVEFVELKNKFDELKNEEKYEELNKVTKYINELSNDISVADMTEFEHLLESLKYELENYKYALQGDNAIAHDLLLDAMEDGLPSSEPVAKVNNEIEEAQYQEVE